MHDVLARANFDRDVEFLSPRFLAHHRWTMHCVAYPMIDVTFEGGQPLRVKLICEQWPELPPSAQLLNPAGDSEAQGLTGGVFHQDAHPTTGKPFVCMRGFREYHSHPSHTTDYWANYRGQDGMNLPGLLVQLSVSWRQAVGL